MFVFVVPFLIRLFTFSARCAHQLSVLVVFLETLVPHLSPNGYVQKLRTAQLSPKPIINDIRQSQRFHINNLNGTRVTWMSNDLFLLVPLFCLSMNVCYQKGIASLSQCSVWLNWSCNYTPNNRTVTMQTNYKKFPSAMRFFLQPIILIKVAHPCWIEMYFLSELIKFLA